jgi:hypothetical protein
LHIACQCSKIKKINTTQSQIIKSSKAPLTNEAHTEGEGKRKRGKKQFEMKIKKISGVQTKKRE